MQIREIQDALKQESLDGWLFFDHHLRDPLAYRILGFEAPRKPTRRWYYFIPTDGDPRAMVHRVEPGMLDGLAGEKIPYSGWKEQGDCLLKLLGGASRIAMQYSPECAVPYVAMVDAGTVELVRNLGVEIVTSANLVQHFEARWNQSQLDGHIEAGRRVDKVRQAAFDKVAENHRNGVRISEWDIRQFIRQSFTDAGMYTDHGPIVAVNDNASDCHYEPTEDANREIKPGDWLLIDLWAKLDDPDAVYYDVTWTGYCGTSVPDEIRSVFDVVTVARDAAVKRVTDAVAASQTLHGFEVDDACRGVIAAAGFGEYFVHRTGHSIGREVHGTGANMDNLETHDERRVIPWTCFSVEPGIYLPKFGVRSEVNVFVGDDEAIVTGAIQSDPILIA